MCAIDLTLLLSHSIELFLRRVEGKIYSHFGRALIKQIADTVRRIT